MWEAQNAKFSPGKWPVQGYTISKTIGMGMTVPATGFLQGCNRAWLRVAAAFCMF
jgi:hypothetical protein